MRKPGLIKIVGATALKRVAPLFHGWEETMIWSALQGCMGSVWSRAEDGNEPEAAVCENGDFFFFAGDASLPEAAELAQAFCACVGNRNAIVTPQSAQWETLLLSAFGGKAVRKERYAIHKDGDCFDRERLRDYVQRLPVGISLQGIDRELYHRVLKESWSYDFCSQFDTAEAYLAHGLGVVALCDGEIVGGASSYLYYLGGIEIEVDTRRDMRRRGIALACCAQLILDCLARGLYPSWDAANRESVALAEKLGYREKETYTILELNKENA